MTAEKDPIGELVRVLYLICYNQALGNLAAFTDEPRAHAGIRDELAKIAADCAFRLVEEAQSAATAAESATPAAPEPSTAPLDDSPVFSPR
jgi:hypothetical protein